MCGVLLVLDVAITSGGHVMAPLDTGIVVVVERGGGLTVVDGVAEVGEAGDHVFLVLTVSREPMLVARISTLHELRAVCS